MARVLAATGQSVEPLSSWEMLELPGTTASGGSTPELSDAAGWLPAQAPGSVAGALRASGAWSFDTVKDFDAHDYVFRTQFRAADRALHGSLWLCFDGLASLCDVWLNGQHLLRSDNMFLAHELDVTGLLADDNQLVLRFASLGAALATRRPRPRYRTRLVESQQLRWFRTTLLGRMPSWTPPVVVVGPWRGVRLERRGSVHLVQAELAARLEAGQGQVRARFACVTKTRIVSATLRVGSHSAPLQVSGTEVSGELVVPDPERWWPNGHGAQARYETQLVLISDEGEHRFELDKLAFREVRAAPERRGLALVVNGVELRCRGACWTPTDVVSLHDDAATLQALSQAQRAGMNMLRVGGTMIYESDAFYEACDRLGIMVFQDFMFANCDYPADDAQFLASVEQEAKQFLARTETRACITVLCGSSEVEQQIAMLGLPKELWKPPLFEQVLRGISETARPDVPYLSSSPSGGPLPFQADTGVTHYYGVGAYLRPLEDARRANVQFASECLAFANIPEPATLEALLDAKAPFHHPRWKARVPRDNGPGWDFDDVRDHYTKLLFGVDPALLRYQDPERALELGRVASGEVMACTLGEWRRASSNCRGALIWLFRDLWPGAGWGIIDANARPKAAYYYVKRAMQPRAVFISDEGVNGLCLHICNDRPESLSAKLKLTLWRDGKVAVASVDVAIELAGRSSQELPTAELFPHFIDTAHAYRFGPAAYEVATATLTDSLHGELISDACHFPGGLPSTRAVDVGLYARAEPTSGGAWQLRVGSSAFAQAVAVDVPDFAASDAYFHVYPGQERTVLLEPLGAAQEPKGQLRALNAQTTARVSTAAQDPT